MLSVRGISKKFGGLVALNDLSVEVKKGLMTMLIGPNGSGKTTLINVISGFYKPDSGTVWFKGEDITGLQPHKIYEKGLVRTFQIPLPFHKLTVLENLLTAHRKNPGESFLKAPIRKTWIRQEEKAVERAFKILKVLNLDEMWETPSNQLSGGQMKLLEAGRATMSGADLIMMDEPASGLFPRLAHEVFAYFTDMKTKFNVTYLVVEHRMEIVLPYIDHVCAMSAGRTICQGKPEKVLNDSKVIESYLGG